MEGEHKGQTTLATQRIGPHSREGLGLLAAGLALLLVTVKVVLLPFPVDSLGEFFRWLLRLALVASADLCFVAALAGGCWLVSALVRRWPRADAAWRLVVFTLFYLAGLYGVLSVPMYKITLVPFTIRLISFAGGPLLMASSIEKYITWPLVLTLLLVPVALIALPRLARRRFAWLMIPQPARLPLAVGGGLAMILYGTVSHAYIRSNWTEPSRWERRISQNPHTVLLGSCLEELLKDRPFTASLYFPAVDDRDFRPSGAQQPPVALPESLLAARPKNVIVVLLESIGAEYLGLYGSKHDTTPNLQRLVQEKQGVVFDNLYVQVPNSCKSIVALSASVYPRLDWQLIVRDSPDFNVPLLSEVLSAQGYRTCYAHSGYWSWRNRDRFLRQRGVGTLIDAETLPEQRINSWGVSDRAMFQACLEWIDARPEAPFFLLAYTIETHHPYAVPAQPVKFGVEDPEQEDYLNAIRAADEQIAWLFEELARRGLDESTLVIVTSDHGESFGQHNQREHMFGIYEPNVHLPLVMFHPGLRDLPRRIAGVREQIDLAPTVLDLLGLESPSQWQGRHLLRADDERPAYFFCVGNNVVLGLRDGKFKYHFYVDSGDEELFDVEADPGEHTNLAARYPQRCADYRQRVGGLAHYQRRFLSEHGAP